MLNRRAIFCLAVSFCPLVTALELYLSRFKIFEKYFNLVDCYSKNYLYLCSPFWINPNRTEN
jgi:hypothetical protein